MAAWALGGRLPPLHQAENGAAVHWVHWGIWCRESICEKAPQSLMLRPGGGLGNPRTVAKLSRLAVSAAPFCRGEGGLLLLPCYLAIPRGSSEGDLRCLLFLSNRSSNPQGLERSQATLSIFTFCLSLQKPLTGRSRIPKDHKAKRSRWTDVGTRRF